MDITLLKPHGYCSGVARAINMSLKIKEEHQEKDVYILGMLVHNQDVVNFLKEKGITTLYDKNKPLEDLIIQIPKDQIVIFTAHGHPHKLDELASKRGLIIYDAVCPKVKSNMELIQKETNNNRDIIYIGYLNHPETNASLSISNRVHLYDVNKGLMDKVIACDNPLVVNQTTLNYFELTNIHDEIKKAYPNATILNEVCPTTRLRQEALKNLSDDIEAIIIIGDQKSSNTTRLYELAKTLHPHKLVIKIANEKELDISLMKGLHHIALSSGASTPEFVSDKVIEKLSSI